MIVRIVPCFILFFKGIGLSLIYIAEAGNIIGVHIQHRLLCILGSGRRGCYIFIILSDAQEYCRQHHQCQQHSDHLSLFLFHIYNSRLSQLFLPSVEPDHESGDHTTDGKDHGNQQAQQQNLCGIH